MKILVVSAYYPPHHIGGYEIGCRDVVETLRRRGHEIRVLAGDFVFSNRPVSEPDAMVFRLLNRNRPGKKLNQLHECRTLRCLLAPFKPDLVFFWSQSELCFWLPFAAWFWGYPTAFFLSDTSFVSWRIGAWLAEAAQRNTLIRALFGKTFLVRGWPVVENRPCHFASEFLRSHAVKHGITVAPLNSVVAHWGIELDQFAAAPRERWPVQRLLYVGQMIEQKGVHTAIRALALLAREPEHSGLTLTLAGGGMTPEYEKKIRALPAELGIAGRVTFLGKVPRAELPGVYAGHDVLVFPSEWEEPFAITPLEAISSGLAVVGTTTGGSGELFRNRETAMTFAAGDAADCARAIKELWADRQLYETIRRQAQREVRSRHTLDVMVDVIERNLVELV